MAGSEPLVLYRSFTSLFNYWHSFWDFSEGSLFDSPIPCTRKVSTRQRYKGGHSFVTVLNKEEPTAEKLRMQGIGLSRTEPPGVPNAITALSPSFPPLKIS